MREQEVLELGEQLKSGTPQERLLAAENLSLMAEVALPVLIPLLEACSDKDDEVLEYVSAALEAIGPPCDSQLSEIMVLLNQDCEQIQYWSVTMLGRAGKSATGFTRPFSKLLNNKTVNESVKQRVCWAVEKIRSVDSETFQAIKIFANHSQSNSRSERLAIAAIKSLIS